MKEQQSPESKIGDPTLMVAEKVFGRGHLGIRALMVVEQKAEELGTPIKLIPDNIPPISCPERDLRIVKAKGYRLVFRPNNLVIGDKDGPLSIARLSEIFGSIRLSEEGDLIFPLPFFSPCANGYCSQGRNWYSGLMKKRFYTGSESGGGWELGRKKPLNGSFGAPLDAQVLLLRQHNRELIEKMGLEIGTSVMGKTATEAVFDLIVDYINGGGKISPRVSGQYDWTTTTDNGAGLFPGDVAVGLEKGYGGGRFDAIVVKRLDGLRKAYGPSYSDPNLGVCPHLLLR